MRLELESPQSAIPFTATESANSIEAADSLREGIKAAQAGNRGRARMCLKRSAELDADNENTWLWLASISEYPEELLIFLNNVLGINPENPRALEWTVATRSLLAKNLVQRGIDAAESGQPEAAIEYFNESLGHEPQNCTAWLWLASLSNSNEEKIVYLEKVLSLEPQNEAANTAHKSAKFDAGRKLVTEASNAAVSGNTSRAIALIDAAMEETPESEEAWILRSHFAESFEEKIRSFEKVLSINPKNAAASSNLDSLRSILAATAPDVEAAEEHEKLGATDFAENATEVTEEYEASELSLCEAFEESALEETFVPDKHPTEELQFPEGISEEVQQDMMKSSANLNADAATRTFKFSDVEYSFDENETAGNTEEITDVVSSEATTQEFTVAEAVTETFEMAKSQTDPQEGAPALELDPEMETSGQELPDSDSDEDIHMTQPANYDYTSNGVVANWDESLADESEALEQQSPFDLSPPAYDDGIPMPYAELPDINETPTPAVNPFESAVLEFKREDVTLAELSVCPFCSSENEAQAVTCQGCMAMLTLSDLEMLLTNQHADKFILRDAVEKMEHEKNSREFTESELTMLGIGHLNLRNLQAGYMYLNEAAQLNPNNVVLSSQANALLIRLEEMKNPDEAHDAMPKGKTILVVDDSPTVRKLIAGKLEKSGHDVFCSNDGVEAMERLQHLVPDLILLDITMPKMDGYQVCKMIRTNDATKNVPVVMISGKDGFFDKVRGRMAGTSGYITKPFGPETLMKAVETYLANGAQAPQD